MTPQTPADETPTIDYEAGQEEAWIEDDIEELPPRPRRKLLSPLPLALLVVLLTAGGFLAGIEVEKSQSSSSAGGGLPSGLAALRSAVRAGGSGSTSGPTGFPGGGAGGAFAAGGLTSGEVSYVAAGTLYVTTSEGNTVKVKAPAGTTVSKTVSTSLASVHPGDTVVVRGSQNKNGSLDASSISISSSGGSSGSSAATGGQQLFGAG
jgi:hypothetical protein